MTRWHSFYTDNCIHFCTIVVQDKLPLLDFRAIQIIYDEWNKARDRLGIKILAYVIMPDHIHLLLWSADGQSIKIFLQRTIGQISKQLRSGVGKFWKERPRVLAISSERMFRQKMEYIHCNPIRRGLVTAPEEWVDSSFRQWELAENGVSFICDSFEGVL